MPSELTPSVRPDFAHLSDPHDETPYSKSLTPAADFNPPPHIAEQILADVSNPLITLHTIALKARTSVEAIHLWLALPDIAQRFDAIESTLRRRARINVLHNINAVSETCTTIMERFYRAPDRGPIDDQDPRTHIIRSRNASNAMMAARVMIHMSRYLDGPVRPQRPTREPRPTTPDTTQPEIAPVAESTAHTNTDNTTANTQAPDPAAFRMLPALPGVDFHDDERIPRSTLPANQPNAKHAGATPQRAAPPPTNQHHAPPPAQAPQVPTPEPNSPAPNPRGHANQPHASPERRSIPLPQFPGKPPAKAAPPHRARDPTE